MCMDTLDYECMPKYVPDKTHRPIKKYIHLLTKNTKLHFTV